MFEKVPKWNILVFLKNEYVNYFTKKSIFDIMRLHKKSVGAFLCVKIKKGVNNE